MKAAAQPDGRGFTTDEELIAILDNPLVAIVTFDENNKIRQFNRGAERIFGYRTEDVLETEAARLLWVPGEGLSRETASSRAYWSETLARGESLEVMGRRRGGQSFPMEISVTVAEMGDELRFVLMALDLTRFKSTEENLRKSEANYRTLMEQASDGIIVCNPDGTIVDANDSACVLTGITRTALIGLKIDSFWQAGDSHPRLDDAMDAVHLSVDWFCLLAGVEALAEMMEEDATTVCGARHRRHGDRRGYRWGRTHSEIGYHGGKVKVARPRVRDRAGKEVSLESWQALRDGNLLLEWALNLMVLNVSTRKYHRAVRLPEGDLAKARGDGTSKSAVPRRFVALSRKKMKAWLASDLSELDLLVIQIDGLHVGDHVLMAAIGVDGNGDKHVLAVVEGATENTVVVQALIDNLLARGLDPTLPRLFIVDGAKALSKAIRNTFGVAAAIQRCQVHKGRNIIERLPQHLHASVKKALRQAWDQDDANKAERLLRNLVRRLEHEEPGVSGSILEGLDEILTVIRLGLPHELRRSLACTNIVENALGTVRQVTRNVKRWRHAEMALRWTAAGLLEAQKTFRRLKAYRQLPILRNALQEHLRKAQADSAIETIMKAA